MKLNKITLGTIFILLFLITPIKNIFAMDLSFDLKLSFESGYLNNIYQQNYINNFKNSLLDKNYKVTSVDFLGLNEIDSGFFINLNFNLNRWGISYSSGMKGILNNTIINYKRSTDSVSYAKINVNGYIFPQNINVFYNVYSKNKIKLNIGGGTGYYIFYSQWDTEIDGDKIENDYKIIRNSDKVNHSIGFNTFFEVAYNLGNNFSLVGGLKGDLIVRDNFKNIIPAINIYLGIQETFGIQ